MLKVKQKHQVSVEEELKLLQRLFAPNKHKNAVFTIDIQKEVVEIKGRPLSDQLPTPSLRSLVRKPRPAETSPSPHRRATEVFPSST